MTWFGKLVGSAPCALVCAALGVTLLGCGGHGSTAALTGGNGQPAPKPSAFDPARAEIMYGVVTRNASGLPTGVKVTWTAQADAVSYNLYRSNAPIPDSARGNTALRIGGPIALTVALDTDFAGAAPLIGQTWFYRISAVDSDGDESRLSPQLQVDITVHFVTALDKATAAVGDTVTITGQNFGIFNASTDEVKAPGVEWQSTVPPGFQPTPILCPIVSWDATTIVVTMPLGWTQGPLSVVIASNTANSPAPIANTDPYITSLSPLSADVTQAVTLQGNNFGAAQDATHFVHFGTKDITAPGNYKSYSNTQILFHPANLRQFVSQQVFVSAVGRTSNIGFCVLTNALPKASATATTTAGSLLVQFDASASGDPEGTALTFDWDFDNDGTFDKLNGGPTPAFTYPKDGTYEWVVRVTDQDGGVAVTPPQSATVFLTPVSKWAMFGHDRAHTGVALVNGPSAGLPRRELATSSSVDTGAVFAADGTIYCGDRGGIAWAFNPDGTTKWFYPSPNGFGEYIGTPAVGSDGTIYFADDSGAISAVNPDGSQKWLLAGPGPVYSSMVIATDGTIYCGCDHNSILKITDLGTSGQLVELVTGAPVYSSPAIGANGTIYAGCDDGKLYAFNPDGSPKWVYDTPTVGDSLRGGPAVNSAINTVYIGSSDGHLYAVIDAGTAGNPKWNIDLSGNNDQTPAIGPTGLVYMGDGDESMYQVTDNVTSATSLEFATGSAEPFTSAAIGANGNVYAGDINGVVWCIDGISMTKIWSYDPSDSIYQSSTSIGPDGVLYVGHGRGMFGYGITNPRPPTGSLLADHKEIGLNYSITFTVDATSPEGVSMTSYDFDFGDGTQLNGASNRMQAHTYTTPGVFTVTAKAHDENSQVGTFTTVVKIWSAFPLVPGASTVRLADVGGHPAVAYLLVNATNGMHEIYFMRANDATGDSWPAPPTTPIYQSPTVDTLHENFDLASTTGSVALIFTETKSLSFMRSGNNGQTWNGPTLIPTLPVAGIDSAHLAYINGIPAIALTEIVSQLLEYNLARNANGSSWNAAVALPLTSLTAVACDLAQVGGLPAIAFCTSNEARYFLAANNGNNGQGLTDWPLASTLVHDFGFSLQDVALTEMKDPFTSTLFPAVAVEQASTDSYVYFITGNLDFSFPNSPVTIEQGPINAHIDLANINNLPNLGWGEGNGTGPDEFYFDRGNGFDGSSWETKLPLFGGPLTGRWESLAQISQSEAVAYLDAAGNVIYSRDPNAAPQTYLTSDVSGGSAPLTVNFDATKSFDPEGNVANVLWNLSDARGQFSDMNLTQQATYSFDGFYPCTITMIDGTGQTDQATVYIFVGSGG